MMILQQTITPEQLKKLLVEGKTDLLDGFVSARTRRKFKAYLVKTPEGKIGFGFEARAPKSPKAATKTKASAGAKTIATPGKRKKAAA
jgi:DNA topoisomerase-3